MWSSSASAFSGVTLVAGFLVCWLPGLGCHSRFENGKSFAPDSRFGNEIRARILAFSRIGEILEESFVSNIHTHISTIQES